MDVKAGKPFWSASESAVDKKQARMDATKASKLAEEEISALPNVDYSNANTGGPADEGGHDGEVDQEDENFAS